jgi:hypothetical protein
MDGQVWPVAVPVDGTRHAHGDAICGGAPPAPDLPARPHPVVPLVRLAWGRSGDKGDISNIGVIARRPEWLPLLRATLTEERVAGWLAHLVKGSVTRFDVPGIHAMNFLCTQALDGGGMGSLRNDPLGKGMAQILLNLPVRVPQAWGLHQPGEPAANRP